MLRMRQEISNTFRRREDNIAWPSKLSKLQTFTLKADKYFWELGSYTSLSTPWQIQPRTRRPLEQERDVFKFSTPKDHSMMMSIDWSISNSRSRRYPLPRILILAAV